MMSEVWRTQQTNTQNKTEPTSVPASSPTTYNLVRIPMLTGQACTRHHPTRDGYIEKQRRSETRSVWTICALRAVLKSPLAVAALALLLFVGVHGCPNSLGIGPRLGESDEHVARVRHGNGPNVARSAAEERASRRPRIMVLHIPAMTPQR